MYSTRWRSTSAVASSRGSASTWACSAALWATNADIGGSYGSGDLSDVALNWMTMQAKTSGLAIKPWKNIGHEE